MSLSAAQSQLADAYKQLVRRWMHVRETWDDPASRQIQKEVLDPLEPMIHAAIQGLNEVSDLMAAARRDCSDD